MKKVLSNTWQSWKALAHRLARFQTILLVTVFYFLVICPIGLLFNLCGWDPLRKRAFRKNPESGWKPVKKTDSDVSSMKRMS